MPALVTGSSSNILIMHSTTAAAVTPVLFDVVVDVSGGCRSSCMPAMHALFVFACREVAVLATQLHC